MKIFGGSGNGSFVEINGSMSCQFDTGGIVPTGSLQTQGGTGAASDVHVQSVEITSSGN
jgi:hypothetical protein